MIAFSGAVVRAAAQPSANVSGHVTGNDGKPLAAANVLLLAPADSVYLSGTTTTADGYFGLKCGAGKYLVKITYLGYNDCLLSLEARGDTDLGTVVLTEQARSVGTVEVVGRRPVVRREIDRIVFDASSISSPGANAFDVLRDTPGLLVDDESITMIGKGEIKIFINGRETKLSGRDLIAMLKTYGAGDVDRVEVITVPPVRYDAEGLAGIVDIKLKKARRDYLSFSLTDSYLFSNRNRNDYAAALNFDKGPVTLFGAVSGSTGKTDVKQNRLKNFPEGTHDERQRHESDNRYFSLRLGGDVRLPHDWTVGAQGEYSRSGARYDQSASTYIYDKDIPSDTVQGNRYGNPIRNRGNVNLHVDKKLDTLGKTMSVDFDWLRFEEKGRENYSSDDALNYIYDSRRSIDNYSAKLDFDLPFRKVHLTAGAKYSYSKTYNTVNYLEHSFPGDRNDAFTYRENVAAVYADASGWFTDKLVAKAGLRMEYTSTEGISGQNGERHFNDYVRLFPTAYLGWSYSGDDMLTVSLSSRISRPSYNSVNPFRFYSSPFVYVQGNPYLKPSYSYSAGLGWTFHGNLSFDFVYQLQDDVFAQLMTVNPSDNTTSYVWENYMKNRLIYLDNSYTLRSIRWMQAYLSHGVYYTVSESKSSVLGTSEGWTYFAAANISVYFNRDKTFWLQVSGRYTSRSYIAGGRINPLYNLDAALRCGLFRRRLELELRVTNILHSDYKGYDISNGIPVYFHHLSTFTGCTISASLRFGAELKPVGRREANDEIRGRL